MLKDSNIFNAVDETEKRLPEGDSVISIKAELLATMKSEVQSAVGAVKGEVLQAPVE